MRPIPARPGLYETLYRKGLYPLYESVLRGRGTLGYLREYERQQWWSVDQLLALQWRKTGDLLRYAQEHVPYYQERWRAAGIEWRDIRSPADFARLPILTKDDVRENQAALIAGPWRGRTLRKSTGGSTGQPLAFDYTQESNERRQAVAMRGYGWAGARHGRSTAYLWSGEVGKANFLRSAKIRLHHAFLRRLMLNSFTLREGNMDTFVEALVRFRPEILVGFTGPLHLLATHCLAQARVPFRPEAIITGAETLLDYQRSAIEAAFEAPVFNTYGCREFMLMASECAEHEGLHMNIDHLVIETVDEAGTPAAAGRVLVTDLHNFAMPFIRYENGDVATRMEGHCACGRKLPRLKSIDGRSVDILRTAEGHTITGLFFPHLMKEVRGVQHFQVVQKSLALLEVSIVRGEGFEDASLAFIEQEVRKVFGAALEIRYHFVADIPLTASGKRRVTISELRG